MEKDKNTENQSLEALYGMAVDSYESGDYVQTKALCEKLVELQDDRALTLLANLYSQGLGVSQSYSVALDLYQKAADAGNEYAMFNLGFVYFYGDGVEIDLGKSASYFESAANKGHEIAMNWIGIMYRRGMGVLRDIEKGVSWLKKSVENGNKEALLELGNIYYCDYEDYQKALEYYEECGRNENAIAILNMAQMYEKGQGTKKNMERAQSLYQEAYNILMERVSDNDYVAQFSLGTLYEKGCPLIGILEDKKEAFHWYEKAAEQEYSLAMTNLGVCYLYGWGVEKNLQLAFHWFSKAAEKGDLPAIFYLGRHYYNGDYVTRDYKKAAEFFEKAAFLGDVVSQYRIGCLYKYGLGVPQDYKQAVSWLKKVCEEKDVFFAHPILADCYMKGLGVEKDERRAIALYTQGAEGGDVESRIELAQLYLRNAYELCRDEEEGSKKAFDLLYVVCQEEERYFQRNSSEIVIREPKRFYVPNDQYNLALYARAYFLIARLYNMGKGVKKDPNEAIRMLRMAEKYGYKDPDNPELTATTAIQQIIEEDSDTLADTVKSYVEIRDLHLGHGPNRGERYAIILHHADGNESEFHLMGRNKLMYTLALMTVCCSHGTKLVPKLFVSHRELLTQLVDQMRIRTGVKSADDWLMEFVYKINVDIRRSKNNNEKDMERCFTYNAQFYSQTKTLINKEIRDKARSENEYKTYELKATGGNRSYMYISISPEQVVIPDSLRDFVNNLPNPEEVDSSHRPNQVWRRIYWE